MTLANKHNAARAFGNFVHRERARVLPLLAVLGNSAGVVAVPARSGFFYARLHGDPNQLIQAQNATTLRLDAGVTVEVQIVRKHGGANYAIVGLATAQINDSDRGNKPGTHGADHERRDLGQGGPDPVDVYPRAFVPLRARAQTTPDLTLHAETGFYERDGRHQFAGGDSPAFVPPTGSLEQRFDLLYLDANDALAILTGDVAVGWNVAATFPVPITGTVPLAYVFVYTSQTQILDAHIYDARTWLAAVGLPHAQQTANHRIESWVYADATARAAATGFVAGDVGRIGYQSDDGSYWRLTDDSPVAWEQVGGFAGGTPADTVTTEMAYGQASAAGAETTYSRGDHTHGTPAVPAHGDLSSIGTDDHHAKAHTHNNLDGSGQLQLAVDVARYGFVDNTQTSIGFDGTNTFTLTDAGAGWDYYRAGVRYHISGNKTVTLSGSPPATAGMYFIYIDATDGALTVSTSAWTLLDTKVPVAIVAWNNAMTPKYWLMDERHTCLIDRRMHYYEHATEGTKFVGGGIPSGYAVAPTSPADVDNRFGVAETYVADEDLNHTLAALSDPSGTAVYAVWYRTAAATWAWQMATMPYYYTGGGYINYDNAGTMTQGTANYFINTYLIYTNLTGDARYILVNGRAQFATLALAQAENPGTFSWSGISIAEFVIAYQFTWELKNSYGTNGKCRLAAEPKRLNIALKQTAVGTPTFDHNSLGGLQGGQAAQYYHIDAAQHASIVGAQVSAYLFLR